MKTLRASARRKPIVFGGEKKSKSITRVRDGMTWNERSVRKGIGGAESGRTSLGSTCRKESVRVVLGRLGEMSYAYRSQAPV